MHALHPAHEAAISAARDDLLYLGADETTVAHVVTRLRDAARRVKSDDVTITFPEWTLRVTLAGTDDEPSRLAKLLRR